MATEALFVKLEAGPGQEDAVEEFLLSARPPVRKEPDACPSSAFAPAPGTRPVNAIADEF